MKNKINKKIIYALLLIIIIVLSVLLIVYVNTRLNKKEEIIEEKPYYGLIDMENKENVKIENNVKENISDKLLQEKKFEEMTVKEIQLIAKDATTNFTATIENTSQKDYEESQIEIVFLKEDGSEYGVLPTYLASLKIGETTQINASTTSDLTNAYDFMIRKVK